MKTAIWDANGIHHHYWDEENRLENTENKYKELQATAAYQAIFQEFADYYTAICDDFYLAKFNEDMHYHQTPETALYFYHPDHLGSASWITDSSGKAIQHLQYLPFGETRIDQRATGSNWSTRYSFSAKEKDEESGYGYFGARYYDSDLSIWLSVDPLANKYPSLSPYNYCANNPIKLIDPNGMEVEFNSFTDRVVVAFAKLSSADFRAKFKELKKSDETYVFNHNKEGKNSFTTDGDKLFINYSINDKQKADGQTIFSNLRHETTHAVQFEHGELGFRKMPLGDGSHYWEPIFNDIQDEIEAHNSQNLANKWSVKPGSNRDKWNNAKDAERIDALRNTPGYSHLPLDPINSPASSKQKGDNVYMLPHTSR